MIWVSLSLDKRIPPPTMRGWWGYRDEPDTRRLALRHGLKLSVGVGSIVGVVTGKRLGELSAAVSDVRAIKKAKQNIMITVPNKS